MGRKKITDINIFDKSNIKYFYGITNYNSIYSSGKLSPMDAYEYAYKLGLNFMFITDQNSYLSEEVYLKENKYSKFQGSKIYASRIRKKYNDFIPLVGFKCSTSSYGDINIINTNNFFNGIIDDFKILTLWMLNNADAFITLNNPNKNSKLVPYNEVLNKIITSVEISNSYLDNKIFRNDLFYFTLLDAGWMLGTVSASNNGLLNTETSECLTVCLCNTLSTSNIISSIRERRTYSTESKYLKFYFTINDTFMGEEISSSDKLRFNILPKILNIKLKKFKS